MSDWTPTDEQVEKAARAVAYNTTNGLVTVPDDMDRAVARAVLVAVGPMIAEAAWDVGVALGYEYGRYDQNMFHANAVPTNNPFRQEAGR